MINALRLAEVRQGTYQLLALMLLQPDEPTIQAASEGARLLRRLRRSISSFAFYPVWERFLRQVETLTPDQYENLERAHISLFGRGNKQGQVSLHETEYLGADPAALGEVLADLERDYSSSGLSASLTEAADHAAVELEYMAFLCGQEIDAQENGDLPRAVDCMERERNFLERHPCRWFPILAQTVNQRDEDALYALTVDAARAMATHDVDFLETVATHLQLGVEQKG